MFVGSHFCAQCGAEATRPDAQDDTSLHCPRCTEPMQSLMLGEHAVRECAECGGLWVNSEMLQRLCNARETMSIITNTLAARKPTSPSRTDAVRYLDCPRCSKLMNRVNFAKSSGVIMDVCKTDGVWLDRGELQRIVTFVEQGGMSDSREQERERLVAEQRRLTVLQSQPSSPLVGAVPSRGWTWTPTLGNRTPLEQLLWDALDVLTSH